MARKYTGLVAFIIALVGVGLLWSPNAHCAWNFIVPAAEVKPQNGVFVFPAGAFQNGKAQYFLYKHSPSQWVRFFVVKSRDGIIRAAFDACDVCFRNKKGYVQRGNFMVCVNCGLKFRTDKVNEVRGGCNPSPLRRTMQGDRLTISQRDVLAGLRFFQ